MSEPLLSCVNCGSSVSSPYCGNCGQKNPPKKITFLSLYTDFQNRIYGLDGMLPRTVRDLTVAPGTVARSFIEGNRVKYVGPVGYFFLTLTLTLLLMQMLDVDIFALSEQGNPFVEEQISERQQKASRALVAVIAHNFRIFSFLQVPLTALFAMMLFRKHKLNFLEHSVFVFYVSGHLVWLSIINVIVFASGGWNLSLWQIPVNTLFFAFAASTFYTANTKVKAFFKGLLVSLLSFFIYLILILVAGVAYILTNPELVELLRNK